MRTKGYLKLIQQPNNNQINELWTSLSAEDKDELLLSHEESFDPVNLISHEEVKKQHGKWLGK